MTGKDIYCRYELERRPPEEFRDDPEFGLVHFRNVAEPHTILGDLIRPQTMPPPAAPLPD